MFPDTLYISDPSNGYLYAVDNSIVKPVVRTVKEVRSLLIAQNQTDIYTVNRDDNSITRINKGVSLGDIRVGRTPYGICEDPNGTIYVTNYSDSTVSIIRNNMVESIPILVDKGPRGIVSDSNGNIWVACYLANTVVKIVNRTVVDRIPVAFNPEGITCDIQNNIWVACSGSNSVVKIAKSKKVLTKETGKRPIAVVTDRNLNVYVANFEDDTVTVINSKGDMASTTIAVGDGPSAIAVDSQNYVYVASSISGEDVYKIHPKTKEVIERIHVCRSPSAFGDFTGCAAYNVFNPFGTTSENNGIPKNATDFLGSLEPTFRVIGITETSTVCRFKVDSQLLNLNKFDHITLNNTAPDADGWFTLQKEDIGNYLILRGYFQSTNESPIIFKYLLFRNIFGVKVGMVDQNYNNWQLLYEKVVDFNTHDIVASVVNTGGYASFNASTNPSAYSAVGMINDSGGMSFSGTAADGTQFSGTITSSSISGSTSGGGTITGSADPAPSGYAGIPTNNTPVVVNYDKGHVVCLVPSRIYAISKDYLTVNSGYAFGNGWLPDLETQKEELEKIMASGISEDDLKTRTILFNPDETEAASLFFFHFYRIEA